jgi:ankyrin repeat protein
MVRYLLFCGADSNFLGGREGSPLGFAVWAQQEEVIDMLLDAGADPNLNGANHTTPLHIAITRIIKGAGTVAVVSKLLERGADVNRQAPQGALRLAVTNADKDKIPEVVRLLVQYGADVHCRAFLSTPMQLAKDRRYVHGFQGL